MGTNYYLHETPACPHCGRTYEPLHIGKSSGGWCFSLHVIPERGLVTLEAWQDLWSKGGHIKNEYGHDVTPDQMTEIIIDRGYERGEGNRWWNPANGDESSFHRRNDSERGPNGLLRHQIDPSGRHCIGHGEGTWDYITGEFS